MERNKYASLIETLDLRQLKALDPLTNTEPGPFQSPCFNVYYSLPEDVRPAVLLGLNNMAEHFFLTKVDLARLMERADDDLLLVDLVYSQIANDFAELFDPSFSDKFPNGGLGTDDRVWELRRIFYRMILTQSVTDVKEAVKVIVENMEFDPTNKESVVDILKQHRGNKIVWNAIVDRVRAANGGYYPGWWGSYVLGTLGII